MPETGFDNVRKFAKEVKNQSTIRGELSDYVIRKLVDKFDQDYLGSGAECVVVNLPGNRVGGSEGHVGETEIVAAINYGELSPLKAKEIFYSQRILEVLFPHNFPHFFAVAGKVNGKVDQSGSIRQKIKPIYKAHYPYSETFTTYDERDPKYPFSKVLSGIREMGLPIRLDDPMAANYTLAADGGVYYLDTLEINPDLGWNVQAIDKYMKLNGHTQKDFAIVRKTINRLRELKSSATSPAMETK